MICVDLEPVTEVDILGMKEYEDLNAVLLFSDLFLTDGSIM